MSNLNIDKNLIGFKNNWIQNYSILKKFEIPHALHTT